MENDITESTYNKNDSFYADIKIVDNWLERAIADDEELIMSMLQRPECEDENVSIEPKCTCKDTGDTIAQHGNKNSTSNSQMQTMQQQTSSSQQISSACTSQPSDPVSGCADVLQSLARQHGLSMHDVDRDGDCLLSSLAYQLQALGYDVNTSSLYIWQMVASYFNDHSDFYSSFVHKAVASNDGYSADNEAPDEENAYIESVSDLEVWSC